MPSSTRELVQKYRGGGSKNAYDRFLEHRISWSTSSIPTHENGVLSSRGGLLGLKGDSWGNIHLSEDVTRFSKKGRSGGSPAEVD